MPTELTPNETTPNETTPELDRGAAYVGRFAPSPSGPLHAGSLATALASYLDARAARGRWLVRIEDIDGSRSSREVAIGILGSLEALGFVWDGPVVWQSGRAAAYAAALEKLRAQGRLYGCSCTRREVADSAMPGADGAPIYPGTCRAGLAAGRSLRSLRLRVPDETIVFEDRHWGTQACDLARQVGDFVLARHDGPGQATTWAYQLAVVVDDAAAGVTDVVRGADLLESTGRQIFLQRCLGLATPRYLHVPLVTDERGRKLSKQNHALRIDPGAPLAALTAAAAHLGLALGPVASLPAFWRAAVPAWAERLSSPASTGASL